MYLGSRSSTVNLFNSRARWVGGCDEELEEHVEYIHPLEATTSAQLVLLLRLFTQSLLTYLRQLQVTLRLTVISLVSVMTFLWLLGLTANLRPTIKMSQRKRWLKTMNTIAQYLARQLC